MKSAVHQRKHVFISIVARVLVNFLITFAVIAALQSIWYFTITLSFAVRQLQSTKVDLLNAAKAGLQLEDIESLAGNVELPAEALSKDPRYQRIITWLDEIHKVSPTSWPFVFVPGESDDEIINLVDLDTQYSAERANQFQQTIPFSTEDDARISKDTYWHVNGDRLETNIEIIPEQWEQAIRDNQVSQQVINQVQMNLDSLGNWITIYSYMRDGEGNIVAGVGIEIENSIVATLGSEILRQLLFTFLGSLLIMVLLGMRLGTRFSKPIVRLTQAAEVINTGDHEEGLKKLHQAGSHGPFRNEIDQLIDTISRLVNFQHTLYTITSTASDTIAQTELFNLTFREIHELFMADGYTIVIANPDDQKMLLTCMIPGGAGTCDPLNQEYEPQIPPDLIGHVIQDGQSLNLTKKQFKGWRSEHPTSQVENFTAWLGVPLKWSDTEIIGAIAIQSACEKAVFSENDKAMLQFIANQLAMILKRNKSEVELRQSHQLLEKRVTERTTDLQQANSQLLREIVERERAEKEMLQAKEAAEAANISKSVFLANMSHELRTPLNAILGFSNLMTHDPNLPQGHKEDLAIIQQSGEHLLDLINDVLEMSKIEAGRNTLNPTNLDLHQLLKEVEEVFQSRAGEKGLSLIFEMDQGLPQYIQADEKKLRQIFFNLLSNAWKFTEKGGVTLRGRRTESLEDGRVHLAFEVEDTGQGIVQDQIKDLFNYFVQTDTGKKSQEGTGLGLAISQNFVRLMGGEITVDSEPGKGSLFSFDILVGLATEEDMQIAPRRQKVVGIKAGQSLKKILVVEDRDANRKLLVKLLQPFVSRKGQTGFEIREAVNGLQALQLWEEWSPDLIFMDMRMPQMNGHEATRRIRETTKGQAVIIVALTASAFEEDRKVILSEGINDFIRKPFKEHEIFDVISKQLGVIFEYADDQPHVNKATGPLIGQDTSLTQGIQSMPSEWTDAMKQAAFAADGEKILALIRQMPADQEETIRKLEGLVTQYRFDLISKIIS